MPAFVYRAKKGPGDALEGELNAESREAAVRQLDRQGLSPVWVREKAAEARRALRFPGRRVSLRDVTMFTRQLASLIRAGIPILRALSTIREQTDNARFRRIVEDLEATVRDGKMLSEALVRYPELFSELYVNMIRAGETGGVLDTILSRLANSREQDEDLRRKVQSAIAYPALIVVVGMATVFVLLAFFLPRVVELFQDYNSLPLPTRALIAVSHFCSSYWYWMVLFVGCLAAVYHRFAAGVSGRMLLDRVQLGLPVVGVLARESDIARFSRTLALLIEAGIPIDRALSLSGKALTNTVLRQEVETIRRTTVTQGLPVSVGMKRSRFFPVMMANMAAVGEEAGHLDEALGEVASFYEKDLELQTRLITSLLEPFLILIVGAIVGAIVAAMLLPIFEMGKGL